MPAMLLHTIGGHQIMVSFWSPDAWGKRVK